MYPHRVRTSVRGAAVEQSVGAAHVMAVSCDSAPLTSSRRASVSRGPSPVYNLQTLATQRRRWGIGWEAPPVRVPRARDGRRVACMQEAAVIHAYRRHSAQRTLMKREPLPTRPTRAAGDANTDHMHRGHGPRCPWSSRVAAQSRARLPACIAPSLCSPAQSAHARNARSCARAPHASHLQRARRSRPPRGVSCARASNRHGMCERQLRAGRAEMHAWQSERAGVCAAG